MNFSGRVLERGNRKPLAGAEVALPALGMSDRHRLPGTVLVPRRARGRRRRWSSPRAEFQRFETTERIDAGKETRATYHVLRTFYSPYETVVRGAREKKEVTQINISLEEVQRIPGTTGDAIKVVQNLPGVARPPFNGGLIVIRGTSPRDSGIFLDAERIPLLFHFGGLTAVFNSELLESVDYFPGNFSVVLRRRGGRRGGRQEQEPQDRRVPRGAGGQRLQRQRGARGADHRDPEHRRRLPPLLHRPHPAALPQDRRAELHRRPEVRRRAARAGVEAQRPEHAQGSRAPQPGCPRAHHQDLDPGPDAGPRLQEPDRVQPAPPQPHADRRPAGGLPPSPASTGPTSTSTSAGSAGSRSASSTWAIRSTTEYRASEWIVPVGGVDWTYTQGTFQAAIRQPPREGEPPYFGPTAQVLYANSPFWESQLGLWGELRLQAGARSSSSSRACGWTWSPSACSRRPS